MYTIMQFHCKLGPGPWNGSATCLLSLTNQLQKRKIRANFFYRKETKHNIDLRKFALAQEEWHDVLQESDADIAYEHFIH